MDRLYSLPLFTLVLIFLLSLTGCDKNGVDVDNSTGSISILVTDAPIDDALEVNIAFTGVTLKRSGAQPSNINFAEPVILNLLDYQGDNSFTLVSNQTVRAGEYDYARLIVDLDQSEIVTASGSFPFTVPFLASAKRNMELFFTEDSLLFNETFEVSRGENTSFVVDIDLRKSIYGGDNGTYNFIPSLRTMKSESVGTITGSVNNSLINDSSCDNSAPLGRAIYVFSGIDRSLQDIQGNRDDPLTTANIEGDSSAGFTYTVGYLPAGDYTLAYTCDADKDNINFSNSIDFLASANVVVIATASTNHDF